MPDKSKFMINLIQLLRALSGKHLFALVFVGISAFFAALMILSYRKSVRRNFRPAGDKGAPSPVDARRLAGAKAPLPSPSAKNTGKN